MSDYKPTCNCGVGRSRAISSDVGCSTGGDDTLMSYGGNKRVSRKHEWTLVHRWRNILMKEALLKVEKVTTVDFNVAEGLAFQEWLPQNESTIRPWSRKLVKT